MRKFLALAALLTCSPAYADASLFAGATLTLSNGLGYESPYPGVTVRGDFAHGAFIARAEAAYLWAEKRETSDGNGQTASALAGVRFGAFDAMAGATYARQETSAWEKDATRAIGELGYNWRNGRAALIGSWNDGREESYSYGARVETGKRFRFVVTAEQIHFTSHFGVRGEGTRASMAYLWAF